MEPRSMLEMEMSDKVDFVTSELDDVPTRILLGIFRTDESGLLALPIRFPFTLKFKVVKFHDNRISA